MGLFTPHKQPNKFNYIPRFYDPIKEAREQRRRELRGESVETDNAEYTPGMYLRTQREARAERRRASQGKRNGNSGLVIAAGVALLVLFIYMLYPRVIGLLSSPTPKTVVEEYDDGFDPYAPITVVPNDYQGE